MNSGPISQFGLSPSGRGVCSTISLMGGCRCSCRGGLSRVKGLTVGQHGAGHREQAVGHRTQSAGVSMPALAQGGILGPTAGIMLHGDPSPMIDSIGQTIMSGLAPQDEFGLPRTAGHRSDPTQAPQGVIVSSTQDIPCLCQRSVARTILPTPGKDLRIVTSRCPGLGPGSSAPVPGPPSARRTVRRSSPSSASANWRLTSSRRFAMKTDPCNGAPKNPAEATSNHREGYRGLVNPPLGRGSRFVSSARGFLSDRVGVAAHGPITDGSVKPAT